MGQRIVVDLVPVALDECADEQEQRRLRLVEVGDELVHDLVGVARCDDDLRATVEHVEFCRVEPVEQVADGLAAVTALSPTRTSPSSLCGRS